MPLLNDQQCRERLLLQQALQTVTKVEPLEWAAKIHGRLAFTIRQGYNVNQIVDDLENMLDMMHVDVCTGGNIMDGWQERKAYLSEKQRSIIIAWIDLALRIGGTFDVGES